MIAGLILAAGQGKRLGQVKPLLAHDHATLLERVIRAARPSKLDSLIVVLGHEARHIVSKIPMERMKVVINGQHRVGLSSSIQKGLAHVPSHYEAVLIALGDMPLVTTRTIDLLIAEFKKSAKGIVVPLHNGQRGHPVIIAHSYLEKLLELRGDVGAKAIIDAHPKDVREVPIDSDEVLIDIDTRDDWDRVRARLSEGVAAPVVD
jgi:molybdenum cofactor cytidylyltransferase